MSLRTAPLDAAAAPMSDILFIKTSSLGDVVHHMPAVVDARRERPDARITWLIEENFAPLARLHPAVDEVIPVASRRWRRALHRAETWGEIRAFVRCLRARNYDAVVDTQGLVRTAVLARFARGCRHGYDRASVREPLASLLYDVRHRVDRALHAVARNRRLTGLALGYAPSGPADFGLDRGRLAPAAGQPYALMLHATARREKEWPEENWIALGHFLSARGQKIILPWGSESERQRAERIAARVAGAQVAERAPLDAVARLIAGASVVVGVDTGLLHLAAALGVPLVAIFLGSEPGLTGPVGSGRIEVAGQKGITPGEPDVIAAVERLA
jgi:heptosyltransferase-1